MSEQAEIKSQSLITRERTSKLDLLIHLLTNLNQGLVICGPDGIGKTTLLEAVRHYKADTWQYCLINGHAELSFEHVLKHLSRSLQPGKPGLDAAQLPAIYGQFQSQNKKLVLMIDDAGTLVPGLITSIIKYAEANPVIRVVLALTHDDMFVLGRSDRVIDDCHLIELPPLSEAQCGEFLQYLAARPKSQVAVNTISDDLIAHIYRETRGIPGKIIAELPVLAKPKGQNTLQWLLTLILAICLVALAAQWLRSERSSIKHLFLSVKTAAKPPSQNPAEQVILAPQAPVTPEPVTPAPVPEPMAGGLEQIPDEAVFDSADDAIPVPEELPGPEEENLAPVQNPSQAGDVVQPAPSVALPEPIATAPAPAVQVPDPQQAPVPNQEAVEQSAWLVAQPVTNYSLQLMVINNSEPVLALQKKYPEIAGEIRYLKRAKYGKVRFYVLYGSFANAELAKSARNSLPDVFKEAMPRPISAIINEMK